MTIPFRTLSPAEEQTFRLWAQQHPAKNYTPDQGLLFHPVIHDEWASIATWATTDTGLPYHSWKERQPAPLKLSLSGRMIEVPINQQVEEPSLPLSVQSLLDDPSVSYWLKDALRTLMARDPLDAYNDASVLLALLKDHIKTL